MKIFIIGSKGLLGSELVSQAQAIQGIEITTSDISDGGIDITSPESVDKYLNEVKPNVIINCAAYTNVDGAEEEPGFSIAMKVNAEGPRILAEKCKELKINLVHISSDYVFGDNLAEGYREDYTNFKPLNKYAETKLKGDQNIIEVFGGLEGSDFKVQEPKAYIIRTSWLFGKGATNFIAKIIELAKTRDSLSVVTDEVSSPTYVKDLSKWILYLAEGKMNGGIYHVSGRGKCSRFEFAKKILEYSNINTPIHETTLDKFERKTKIANISYLVNTKLPEIRSWEEMVEDFVLNSK